MSGPPCMGGLAQAFVHTPPRAQTLARTRPPTLRGTAPGKSPCASGSPSWKAATLTGPAAKVGGPLCGVILLLFGSMDGYSTSSCWSWRSAISYHLAAAVRFGGQLFHITKRSSSMERVLLTNPCSFGSKESLKRSHLQQLSPSAVVMVAMACWVFPPYAAPFLLIQVLSHE